MSPCDIPLRVRIFLMLSPSLLLINIIIAYEILHFQTILYYNSSVETAKQNQKFPFHFFFRFAAEGWGEEAREKCKEIFWFLHTRVRERVRGAHHWSSGFNSKYIRTSFNTHRQNSESEETDKATLMHSPRRIQNPKGFSTLRVARRLPIQFYE